MGSIFSCGRSHQEVRESLNKCEKRLSKHRKTVEELKIAIRDQECALADGLKNPREEAKIKFKTQRPTEEQILNACVLEVRDKIQQAQKNINDWSIQLLNLSEKIALLEKSQKVLQNGLESTEETEDDAIIAQAMRIANRQTQRKEYLGIFSQLSDASNAHTDETIDSMRQMNRRIQQNNTVEVMEKDRIYEMVEELRDGETSILGSILDRLDEEDQNSQNNTIISTQITSAASTSQIQTQNETPEISHELVNHV